MAKTKKKTAPTMDPVLGFALLAIHAARQRGYTLDEIHQAASGEFTPAEGAEIEAHQIAHEGRVFDRLRRFVLSFARL